MSPAQHFSARLRYCDRTQLIAHSKDFSNVGDGEASPTGKIQVVKAVAGE